MKRLGKWIVVIYVAQAMIGVGVGVGAAVMYPEKIEEVLSCVTH